MTFEQEKSELLSAAERTLKEALIELEKHSEKVRAIVASIDRLGATEKAFNQGGLLEDLTSRTKESLSDHALETRALPLLLIRMRRVADLGENSISYNDQNSRSRAAALAVFLRKKGFTVEINTKRPSNLKISWPKK